MTDNSVPTGVEGLDSVLGGGFPRNSLIIVAGNPGTGKTIFSAQFIYRGATEYGENGVYVSFAESRKSFIDNMRQFGFDFEKLESEGKFRYLDFLTVREAAISAILDMILKEIKRLKAKRLVIDSFSAMSQAFEREFDARVFIHAVLSRIMRQVGCTTILIDEIPYETEHIGGGMEEFVADGIILLRAIEQDERLFRDLLIKKMRGKEITEDRLAFTLKGGFRVFPPFKSRMPTETRRFKPIEDNPDKFSTGSADLDRLLDGGYPKGSTVLLEIGRDISNMQYHLILAPTAWNFLANNRGVIIVPSSGVSYDIVKSRIKMADFPEDMIGNVVQLCILEGLSQTRLKHVVRLEGRNIQEDFQKYAKASCSIRVKTGQPILHIVGVDRIASYYGAEGALKILNTGASIVRENGDLLMAILKPNMYGFSDILNAIADVHLKIIRQHGALLLYGRKPRTRLYFVEAGFSEGYPLPALTPVL